MRVGFITQWYPPEHGSAALPGTIVSALATQGHDVKVITGYPNYPEGRIQEGWRQRLVHVEQTRSATVYRTPLLISHDNRAWRRMLNYASFAVSATVTALFRLRRADVTWVHATPVLPTLAAMTLKRVAGVPYVVHVQDLWPDTVFASGMLNERLTWLIRPPLDWFCGASYRHAAVVAVIAPGMRTMLLERGVPAAKIVDIPNWADESIFHRIGAQDGDRAALGLPDGFVAMYAGAVGEVQGLETLIRAAVRLKDRPNIHIAVVGDGVARDRLADLASHLGLKNVHFVPPQPLSSMSSVLASADVQIICLSDAPLYRITLPSKVQATMAAGLPMIVSAGGDAAEVTRDAGSGLVCPPGDDRALAEAIARVADGTLEERESWGASGAKYYQDHLSEKVGVSRMIASLRKAADHKEVS